MPTTTYTIKVGDALREKLDAIGRVKVRELLCKHFGVEHVPMKLGRPPKKKFKHPAFPVPKEGLNGKPDPVAGERWDEMKNGVLLERNYIVQHTARVMDVVEDHVVARFKGAIPFVMHLNDWHARFTKKPL